MRPLSNRTSRVFWMVLAAIAISQALPSFAQETSAATAIKTKTFWEMLQAGGLTLYILAGLSIFTVTLLIERFMYYRSAAGNAGELVEKIKQAHTLADASTAIEHAPGIAGRVIRTAVQAARDGYKVEQIEGLAESAVTKELISMERFLPQLDSMVTMCPLIGLLGTTIGMIKSFGVVAAIGMSDPTKLAGGISEALVNTAAGLAVAIPSLFAYNYFSGKKEAILMDLEQGLTELMVILKSSIPH
jgi:biopolymer transport protein ExbB